MIGFFPEIYSDELVYSWFARYYVRTGYTSFIAVAEDLYERKTTAPSFEFINGLSEDAYQVVTKNQTFEEIIMKHTMFPAYARFLPRERRIQAFERMLNMDAHYHDAVYTKKHKVETKAHIRYCPCCAKEDREKYGETYWHRAHQLDGIDICPVHHCKLMETKIRNIHESPMLFAAESAVPHHLKCDQNISEIEERIAEYALQVFQAEVNMENEVLTGDFLHSRLEYTPYLSVRGEARKMNVLKRDLVQYYADLPEHPLSEIWYLQKLFTNDKYHHKDICMLAMFLEIPVADLVNMSLPEKSQHEIFDETVWTLHDQGFNYREIAKKMGASYDVVKLVGRNKYKKI